MGRCRIRCATCQGLAPGDLPEVLKGIPSFLMTPFLENIALRRQVLPRRLNRKAPEIVGTFRGAFALRIQELLLGRICRHRSEHFHLPLPRSEPCRMAQRQSCIGINPDLRRHLFPAQGDWNRMTRATSQMALKMRKETMSGIWRWPKLKSWPAILSRRRTTTSTPNIILDRWGGDSSNLIVRHRRIGHTGGSYAYTHRTIYHDDIRCFSRGTRFIG
jgi:hypothetical protein